MSALTDQPPTSSAQGGADRAAPSASAGTSQGRWRWIWAPLVGFLAALALTAAFQWPVPLHLRTHYVVAAFNGDHVWAFDHIARMLTGQEPLSTQIDDLGFPEPRDARLILWVPSVLAMPLRPLLGPLGAYNLIILLSPGLSLLVTWAFLRRLTRADGWVCSLAALTYVLSPYVLGSLASGQMAKIQLWIPPLYLMALHGVMTGPRRWAWLLLAGASLLMGVFTSASTSVFLPFAAVVLVIHQMFQEWPRPWRPAGWALLAAGISAASMYPALSYYAPLEESPIMPAFMPGRPPPLDRVPDPPSWAEPVRTFLGTGYFKPIPWHLRRAPGEDRHKDRRPVRHMTYIGLPILALGLLLSVRRFSGRGFAWGLVVVGLVLAAGPYVVLDGEFVLRGGRRMILPAWFLDKLGYPTARSGMYYRAIHLVSLGLALAFVGGAGRLSRARGRALAIALIAAVAWDTWRVAGPLWPQEVRRARGLDALKAMAADGHPGAVLELPIEIMDYQSQEMMLAAVFHGRHSTCLPQDRRPEEDPTVARLTWDVGRALASEDPAVNHAALARLGFRYVIFRPHLHNHGDPLPDLKTALGPPSTEGELLTWRIEAGSAN